MSDRWSIGQPLMARSSYGMRLVFYDGEYDGTHRYDDFDLIWVSDERGGREKIEREKVFGVTSDDLERRSIVWIPHLLHQWGRTWVKRVGDDVCVCARPGWSMGPGVKVPRNRVFWPLDPAQRRIHVGTGPAGLARRLLRRLRH